MGSIGTFHITLEHGPAEEIEKSWTNVGQGRFSGLFPACFILDLNQKNNRKPLIFLGFAVKLLTRIELVTSTLPTD